MPLVRGVLIGNGRSRNRPTPSRFFQTATVFDDFTSTATVDSSGTTASLIVVAAFASTADGVTTGTATPTVLAAFTSTANGVTTGTATLTVLAAFTSTANALTAGTATLTVLAAFASTAGGVTTGTATPTILAAFTSTASAVSTGIAALTAIISLASVVSAQTIGQGALTVLGDLRSTGAALSTGIASPTVLAAFTSSATVQCHTSSALTASREHSFVSTAYVRTSTNVKPNFIFALQSSAAGITTTQTVFLGITNGYKGILARGFMIRMTKDGIYLRRWADGSEFPITWPIQREDAIEIALAILNGCS